MAKYYVQSGNLRLVLDAGTARDAAMRAVRRCHDRQAEIFRQPGGDRIRDIEVLDWQVDRQIRVSETGFGQSEVSVFETSCRPKPELKAVGHRWPVLARYGANDWDRCVRGDTAQTVAAQAGKCPVSTLQSRSIAANRGSPVSKTKKISEIREKVSV